VTANQRADPHEQDSRRLVLAMARVALAVLLLMLLPDPCRAEWWSLRAEEPYRTRPSERYARPRSSKDSRRQERRRRRSAPAAESQRAVQDGGGRPDIKPQAPPVVAFPHFPSRSIVIDTPRRKLYFVLEGDRAYAYPISVGRDGFDWTGTEAISNKQAWPDWYPPKEMRQRDPKLPEKMTGGIRNPLGAMALYLGTTLYRIHGTNDPKSVGRAASSGCFRMLNATVSHLASLVEVGTNVTVVSALPARQVRSEPPHIPIEPIDPRGAFLRVLD
jgi:lipoprotein-anchoring transpeptidase ErfK/SrfK